MQNRNPISLRGYKDGLNLYYIDGKKIGIDIGECHYLENINKYEDKIIKLDSKYELDVIYANNWEYHFIYIGILENDMIKSFFYTEEPPIFDTTRGGYYKDNKFRCIGAFFIGDGVVLEFEQITRLHHNYNIPGQIYRFTRKNTELSTPFHLWRSDRIPSNPFFVEYLIYKSWKKYPFKYPKWGNSLNTCNLKQYIILHFGAVNRKQQIIYYRQPQTDFDIEYNLINETHKLIYITGDGKNIKPNKVYNYITTPIWIEEVVAINDSGEIELKTDSRANIIYDISTIGYVLPKFIDNDNGFFPSEFRNIFEGLGLIKINKTEISILPGILSFANPDGIGKLSDSLIYNCDNYIHELLWYYVYVEFPYNTIELTKDQFIISDVCPIFIKEGFYNPIQQNMRCIGCFKVNNKKEIINIKSNHKYYPPDECSFTCNEEVKQILDTCYREHPLKLVELLKSTSYEYFLQSKCKDRCNEECKCHICNIDNYNSSCCITQTPSPILEENEESNWINCYSDITYGKCIIDLVPVPMKCSRAITWDQYLNCLEERNLIPKIFLDSNGILINRNIYNYIHGWSINCLSGCRFLNDCRLGLYNDCQYGYYDRFTPYNLICNLDCNKPCYSCENNECKKNSSCEWKYGDIYGCLCRYDWTCCDPKTVNLTNEFVVYKSKCHEYSYQKININNLDHNSNISFELENDRYLIPFVSEWDICDNYLYNDVVYLYAKKRIHLPEQFCGIFKDNNLETNKLDIYDPVDMHSLNVTTNTYSKLLDTTSFMNIFDFNNHMLDYVKIKYYEDKTKLKVLSSELSKLDIMINTYHPNNILKYEEEIIEGPSLGMIPKLDNHYFKIFDDNCNLLDITNIVPIQARNSITILTDFCKFEENDYIKEPKMVDGIVNNLSGYDKTELQLINMEDTTSLLTDTTSYPNDTFLITDFESGEQHLRNNIEYELESLFPLIDDVDYLEYINTSIYYLNYEENDLKHILIIGNNYNKYNISEIEELYDVAKNLVNDNIYLHVISENEYEDLRILTTLTLGTYNIIDFEYIEEALKEFREYINNYSYLFYNIDYKYIKDDVGKHYISLKISEDFKGQTKSFYEIFAKKLNPCHNIIGE